MNTTISIKQWSRPPRITYFISEQNFEKVLDVLFQESYKRWGGMGTLIVPVTDNQISEDWLEAIKLYDPDIIYTYVEIKKKTLDRLNRISKPFVFLRHNNIESSEKNDLLPNFGGISTNYIKSLSLAPRIVSDHYYSHLTKYFLWKHRSFKDEEVKFISQNFGFSPTKHEIGLYQNKNIIPLGLIPEDSKNSSNASSDLDLKGESVSTEIEFLKKFCSSDGSLIFSPAKLSGIISYWYTENFPTNRSEEHSLELFIGDSFQDLLNFWNTRLRYKKTRFNPLSFLLTLHVPEAYRKKSDFIGGAFRDFLLYVLNHVSELKQIYIYSYSLSQAELEKFKVDLNLKNLTQIKNLKRDIIPNSGNWELKNFIGENRKCDDEIDVKEKTQWIEISMPSHLKSLPRTLLEKQSYWWVADLEIERHNNSGDIDSLKQIWKLPCVNGTSRSFLSNGVDSRINSQGTISIITPETSPTTDPTKRKIKICLPEDKEVFQNIFIYDDREWVRFNYDVRYITCSQQDPWRIEISDKGKSFEKIIQKFGGLYQAYDFISDPVWQGIFKFLISGDKDQRIEEILNTPSKTFLTFGNFQEYINRKEYGEKIQEYKKGLNFLTKKGFFSQNTKLDKDNKIELDEKTRKHLKKCLHEIWILGCLFTQSRENFFYLPQTIIYYSSNKNDNNEVDFICVCDGQLIIGEAKTDLTGFNTVKDNQKTTIEVLKEIAGKLLERGINFKLLLAYESSNENDEDTFKEKVIKEFKDMGVEVKFMKIFDER